MSNGLSQAEIDALLRGDTVPEFEEDTAAAQPFDDPNRVLSPEEIAAMLDAAGTAEPAAPVDDDPNRVLSPEEIAAMLDAAGTAEPAAPVDDDPNRVLSPEEIAAMLDAVPAEEPAVAVPTASDAALEQYADALTEVEMDALGEIGNISMGTAATTLFALLNHRVDITTPRVTITTMGKLASLYPMPFVSVEVQYTVGLEGTNCLFLQEKDVKIITDLMLGGDGTNIDGEFNEMHLSCIAEVMNQMVGASSTSMSQMLKKPIDISPPHAMRIVLGQELEHPFSDQNAPVACTSFDMVVEGLINSEIMQITTIDFAKEMVERLMGISMASEPTPVGAEPQSIHLDRSAQETSQKVSPVQFSASAQEAAQAPPPPGMPAQQGMAGYNEAPLPQMQPQQAYPPQGAYPPQQPYPDPAQAAYPPQQPYPQAYPPQPYPPAGYYPPPGYGYPPQAAPPQQATPVEVKPPQFTNFGGGLDAVFSENMDILLDVPLPVTVELGKSKKYIKDILDFNTGTIIVLDKMAGELVDVVVNGKLIAQGEVVVIDDNYGCRITDIISPSSRLNTVK